MRRGFTLVEFGVVVGILAVITLVVLAVLNPAERFRESRDAQRVADLTTLKKAVSLYLAVLKKPDLDGAGICKDNFWASVEGAVENFSGSPSQFNSTSVMVDGTGWLPINLTNIPGGAPITELPVDPINSPEHAYTYRCNTTNLSFEFNAKMESARYQKDGDDDVEFVDGGDNESVYEVGNTSAKNL
ncbi:MAG: Uncharacterized protein G01um10143_72 [Parcubacteria group bacterium Gr01-1014_3]|nr:MAG: Uncharacterized protein G01um10143_72 [Parcubacteria group bacterium Gr01-1014_3]